MQAHAEPDMSRSIIPFVLWLLYEKMNGHPSQRFTTKTLTSGSAEVAAHDQHGKI